MRELSKNELTEIRLGYRLILNTLAFFAASGAQFWMALTQVAPLPVEDPMRKTLFGLVGILFIMTIFAFFYGIYAVRQQYVWDLRHPKE